MPGIAHATLTECIFHILPQWEQEFWKEHQTNSARYASLPDDIANNLHARYCRLPLPYADQDIAARRMPFCRQPDNAIDIPHGPTDAQFAMAPFAPCYQRASAAYVIDFYFRKMIESLAAGNSHESFIYASVLAHYIEDCSHPIHSVDNPEVYEYLPPPPGKYWQLHRIMDNIPADPIQLMQARPRLLGLSIEEAIFHAVSDYETMLATTKGTLIPLVSAFYAGAGEPQMKTLLNDCFFKAVELTASLWHTAHAIAAKRFDTREVAGLQTVALNGIRPLYAFTIDPYFFAPLVDGDCDEQGNRIPLRLHDSRGQSGTRELRGGLAMAFGFVVYDIPPGIYHEFQATIGLSSVTKPPGGAIFKVVRGGPPVYEKYHTKLVTYGGPVVFESGVIRPDDPAQNVAVSLGDAARITLMVEGSEGIAKLHAIWGEPMLVKSKS